tara:strand:- start:493 stop:2397 length:1905 start_codon:yes stop_codon:yes gene_type:complete
MDASRQARIYVADHVADGHAWATVSMHNMGSVVQWESGAALLSSVLDNAAPDLIFVSDGLTDISGLEICRRLRNNPQTRMTPVILMSEIEDPEFVRSALDLGAVDVLSKPLNPDLLRARIKFYLAMSQQSQALGFDAQVRSDELERMVETMRGELRERERTMARAEFLFSHDLITGLPNRRQLLELMERGRRRADKSGTPMAVVALSIEHYNALQASNERDLFDRTLAGAAQCLQRTLRPLDFVARVSEDMFAAVLMPRELDNMESATRNAQEAAERAATALLSEVLVDDVVRSLQTRIAVAVYPRDGTRGPELLKHIDESLAASRGGAPRERRRPATQDLATALAMELRLRQAIESDRLVPHYQPKVDFKTNRILGGETLIRWPLRSGEYVGPSEFVPIAEAGGLIPSLDDYVLTSACCQIAEWQQRFSDFRISVNLSALKLHHRGVFDRLRELLSTTRARPEHLELEITESALITDFDAAKGWLTAVREMGVKVSLDDFGTGYSSLAYLRRLPMDIIKIDQSFVSGLEIDRSTVAIVRAMISMATALNMEVVAEGVENMTQAEILNRLGCHTLQGFIYSPAVTAGKFEAMLETGTLKPRALGIQSDPSLRSDGRRLSNPFPVPDADRRHRIQ